MTGISRFELEKIFIYLSISTRTGIDFFKNLAIGELGEYERAASEVLEEMKPEGK